MKLELLGLLGLCLALGVPQAEAWTYERVDTAGGWQSVEMEVLPSGEICICYQDTASHHVFLARNDSGWRSMALGPGQGHVIRHLVQGPLHYPAVLLSADTNIVYAADSDTGWTFATIPVRARNDDAALALDTAGNPTVLKQYYSSYDVLESWAEHEGVWTNSLIDEANWIMGEWLDPSTNFVLGSDGRLYVTWVHGCAHTTGCWQFVYTAVSDSEGWRKRIVGGGSGYIVSCISMAPTHQSEPAVCYSLHADSVPSGFFCNSELLEPESYASRGVIREDVFGRLQIVYAMGVLKHAYNTGLWHIDTLPPEIGISDWDFAVDSLGLPLIAFASADGVFLARGDALGCGEHIPLPTNSLRQTATLLRGSLWLPPASSLTHQAASCLLDISGREVLALHPGANDVSRLAPGVYFVHEQLKPKHQAQAVRKIILSQ